MKKILMKLKHGEIRVTRMVVYKTRNFFSAVQTTRYSFDNFKSAYLILRATGIFSKTGKHAFLGFFGANFSLTISI